MTVDCIPHGSASHVAHAHRAAIHAHIQRRPVLKVVTVSPLKPHVFHVVARHPLTLRECPPGTTPVRLADLASVAAPYVQGSEGVAGGPAEDAAASVPSGGVIPAEASGTDLPVPNLGVFGGGEGGGSGGLPPGLNGGGGVPPGGPIGIPPGFPGGGSGGGGSGGGGGGGTPPGHIPSSVPEPSTWALMLTGVGALGGARRRRRALPKMIAS